MITLKRINAIERSNQRARWLFLGGTLAISVLMSYVHLNSPLDPIYIGDINKDGIDDALVLENSLAGRYDNPLKDICFVDGRSIRVGDNKLYSGDRIRLRGFTIPDIPKENYSFLVRKVDNDASLDLIVRRNDLGIGEAPTDTFYNILAHKERQ